MLDNLNKTKFVTDRDQEIERFRLKEEQLKRSKRASVEPFWKDLSESIQNASAQREVKLVNRHGKVTVPQEVMGKTMTKPLRFRNYQKEMNLTQQPNGKQRFGESTE